MVVSSETQQTITSWAQETFGSVDDPRWLFLRALEELLELGRALGGPLTPEQRQRFQDLCRAFDAHMVTDAPTAKQVGDELADTYILLAQLAEHYRVDLAIVTDLKMRVNRDRQWSTVGVRGIGQHIDIRV